MIPASCSYHCSLEPVNIRLVVQHCKTVAVGEEGCTVQRACGRGWTAPAAEAPEMVSPYMLAAPDTADPSTDCNLFRNKLSVQYISTSLNKNRLISQRTKPVIGIFSVNVYKFVMLDYTQQKVSSLNQ